MAKLAGDIEKGALFRYSLIVPALNETYSEKSMNEYFINVFYILNQRKPH